MLAIAVTVLFKSSDSHVPKKMKKEGIGVQINLKPCMNAYLKSLRDVAIE